MPVQPTSDPQTLTTSQVTLPGAAESLEDLGQRLLRVLSPLHVHLLSIYDTASTRLWCSSGGAADTLAVIALVTEALDALTLEAGGTQLLRALPDGRCALFLAAHDSLGERRAIALALLDGHDRIGLATGLGQTPRVAVLLRRLGSLLAPVADEATAPVATLLPPAAAAAPTAADPNPSATARLQLPGEAAASAVHARRYARLRPGGSTRRYELTLPEGDEAAMQLLPLRRLLDFLGLHRERFQREPASFLLPLSTRTVLQGAFVSEAENLLLAADVAPTQIGFCLPRAFWSEHAQAAVRFADECASIGCFIALDEFCITAAGASALLRTPALRCLKLARDLTAHAMSDKLSQALLAAVVQAARVLGLYCVASQVESGHQGRWLASAGVEFADQPERSGGATSSQRRQLPADAAAVGIAHRA